MTAEVPAASEQRDALTELAETIEDAVGVGTLDDDTVWQIARYLTASQYARAAAEDHGLRARVEAVLTEPEWHIEVALGGSHYVNDRIRAAIGDESQ